MSLRIRWDYDWGLLALALLLSLFGLFVLSSAAPDAGFVVRQSVWLLIGLVAAASLQVFSKARLFRLVPWLYLLSLVLLTLVLVFGREVNGARAWFAFGPLRFQPSEFAKLALILMLARVLARRPLVRLVDYPYPLLVAVLPVLLTAVEPDLGGAMVMAATAAGVFFVRGLPWRHLAAAALAAVALFPTVIWPRLLPHQKERILTALNPTRDPLGSGFQVIQSMIAVGSGGLTGKGYGQGTQSQLGFVPFRHTDFIFAVVAEEMGLVGGLALLLAYALLFWRLVSLALSLPFLEDRLVVAGVFAMIAFQVLVNVGVTLGVAPVTGITLPFVSYGGTSLVTLLLAVGLVELVYRDRLERVL